MNSETTSTNEGENVVRTRSRSIGTATPAQQQSVPSTPQRITNPLTSPGFQPQDLKNDAAGSPVQTGTFPITTTPITSPALKESSGGLATPKKKAEAAFDDIVATIFSCSKKAGQVHFNIQVCTRTKQGVLEIRILSYTFKAFSTLYKQLKQNHIEFGMDFIQKKWIEEEEVASIGKRKFSLQRFLDCLSVDRKLFSFQPVFEFFGLNREPDKFIPQIKIDKWKDLAESSEATSEKTVRDMAREHKAVQEEKQSLTSTIILLNSKIQETSLRINAIESENKCLKTEQEVWVTMAEGIRTWANESIGLLGEEIKEKQERIAALVKSCNEISIDNEKLREELRKNNARLMAYEKSTREEAARNELLRARVAELEAENAALLFEKYTRRRVGEGKEEKEDDEENEDSVKRLVEENIELKKRVKTLEEMNKDSERRRIEHEKIAHESMTLRREVLKLNGIIDSIEAEKESHARETTSTLSALLKEENESIILSKKLKSENKTLSDEVKLKSSKLEGAITENKAVQEALDAVRIQLEEMTIKLKLSESEKYESDLHLKLLKFQSIQLLHELAVMTMERDQFKSTPPVRKVHPVYSDMHDGGSAREDLERQNAGYKEQIAKLASDVSLLKKQNEELEKEKASRQQQQMMQFQQQQQLPVNRDRAFSSVLSKPRPMNNSGMNEKEMLLETMVIDLQKKTGMINQELSEVKEKYFYDLFSRLKGSAPSKQEVNALYVELLTHGPRSVNDWESWLKSKLKSKK